MTPALIREAAIRIAPLVHRTPVMTSRGLDTCCGRRIFLKCENFQRGGSFKVRGASNLILSIPPQDLPRGVVAFSSGNHAQGVALAAHHVGTPATIVMPLDAPKAKVDPTRALGATIITYDRLTQDREQIAAQLLANSGATLVPPYDHPLIMAGQGTVALELLEDVPDLDALIICVGGGGLMAGCSTIAKSLNPAIRVFGAEPERASDTWQSLRAGRRVEIPPPDTIADGLRSPAPGKLTFPIVQRNVEDILLVTEDEICQAMRFLITRMKLVVEPSGAVSVAVAMCRNLPPELERVGVVVSGGNVDIEFLAAL